MKRILLILTVLTASGWGQSLFTTVTATPVQDPNSSAYVNGTYNISYVPASGGLNRSGNYAIAPSAVTGTLDSFGNMGVSLLDNSQISPVGSQWRFSICSASGVTCFAVNITISGASQDITAALKAAAAVLPSSSGGGTTLPGVKIVDGSTYTTIQGAITAASTNGSVFIPATYAGTDTYTNPNGIQISDLRPSANRQRGYINVLTDCGLKGSGLSVDGAAESTAIAACMAKFGAVRYYFPPTNFSNNPSYYFASSITPPVGSNGMVITGGSNSWLNSNTQLAGTVLKFPAGVTGIDLQNCGCTIEYISLLGSEPTNSLVTASALNIPSGANLPGYNRSISSIQRAGNVLSVVTTRASGGEGLTQSVGSTVKISGVSGDTSMNGLCIISTLTTLSSFSANAAGFTCAQNGADSGPFGAVGTVGLPTTGASTADGIHVCNNFTFINHVTIENFGRHGINADSYQLSGHSGCTLAFSDDLVLRDSTIANNQGNGYYCFGVDCNAHLLSGNAFYYNVLWAIEDQSSLGNTHIGNQISNNGHGWAAAFTPTTKNISTIARTLSGGDSTVTVVLSQADTNLKLGTCVFIAGVTDSSFNATTGQCFFITSFTDSKNFQYIQPGAPADASSSGGTERPAKFAEAYLSAGVDSGAEKVGTQSGVAQDVILGDYVEGGQECKWQGQTVIIGGVAAGCQFSSTDSDFRPSMISGSCVGFGGVLCSSIGAVLQNKDIGGNINFRAGVTADQTFGFEFLNHSNGIAWLMIANPSGTLGGTGNIEFRSGNGQTRFITFGKDASSPSTDISGEGAGAVRFGRNFAGSNAGTGGVEFWSGGASPAKVASVDSTGLATFNGGVKVASGAQALTSVQGSTGTKVVAATGAFVSGNCTKTDVNGNLVDAATTCGGGSGFKVEAVDNGAHTGTSIAATTLQTFSLSANEIGTNQILHYDIYGTWANGGTATSPTLALKVDGTTVCSLIFTISSATQTAGWHAVFDISATSTAAAEVHCHLATVTSTAGTTAVNALDTNTSTKAIDFTTTRSFTTTVAWDAIATGWTQRSSLITRLN